MAEEATIFILIHGAFHGGWCWERIVPLLEAQGHRVLAPDLLGMGDPAPGEDIFERRISAVADLVAAQPAPVVLVGHSLGGMTISAVAERVPDAIARLVYLAAVIPQSGEAVSMIGMRAGLESDPTRISPDGPIARAGSGAGPDFFYQLCDPADAARAMARLRTEPMAALTSPVILSDENFGRVPRAYIETSEDRVIPIAAQRIMQAAVPCEPVVTLATDHSPFYAMPERLAEVLISLA